MNVQAFAGSSVRQTLISNTLSQIAGRAISALTTLAVTILIARKFGSDGYGDFIKIITFVSFFYLVADFGFNAIYLQRSPLSLRESNNTEDVHWNALLGLRIIVSVILIIVASIILFFMPHGDTQGYTWFVRIGILLFVPTIIFQALITTANALFQKHLRYDLATVAIAAGSCVSLLLVWMSTAYAGSGMFMVVASLLMGGAVTALIGLWYAKTLAGKISITVATDKLWPLFALSIPLGLTLVFNLIYFHIDSVILTLTRSTAEVGIYGLVYKIFELTLVVPTFFMNSLYPLMLQETSDMGQVTSGKFHSLISRSAITLFLLSCLMSLVFWFGAPLISLVRSDFIPGVPALRVLLFGLPLFYLSSLTMWILISIRKQKILMYIYAVCMIINILLNVFFVPRYGYMAAAWVTVVSEALVFSLSGVVVLRFLKSKVIHL